MSENLGKKDTKLNLLRKIGLLAIAIITPIAGVVLATHSDLPMLVNAIGLATTIGYVGIMATLAGKGKLPTKIKA